MSALTKTFVVLLVVLSLLLSAGVIVFAGQVQNFKVANKTQGDQLAARTTELTRAKSAFGALEATLDATRKDLNTALAANTDQELKNQVAVAQLKGQLADANSLNRIMQANQTNTTQALASSEQARVGQAAVVTATRSTNDDLVKKNSDLNLAVSDLTNRLDVATRDDANAHEQLAQARAEISQLTAIVKDSGGSTGADQTGKGFGAPPILAYVIKTTPQNSMTYATINAGTKDQVTKGMKFQLIDRAKQLYLGELTIESTDESQATGKIEGPHVADVGPQTEARTNL